MRSLLKFALAMLAVSIAAFAQNPRPEFEVASIRATTQLPSQVNVGVHVDGAQVNITCLTLKDYIRIAYDVKEFQVIGPDWLASERFDISAKLPSAPVRGQIATMLKTLLEDRFDLKTHPENKEFPVYALVPAKGGIKLKESPAETATDGADPARSAVNISASGGAQGVNINFGKGSYFSFADNKIEARKIDMQRFADTLARFVDKPLVDATEAKGVYDVTLNFTEDDYRAMLIRSALNAGVVLPPQALRLLENGSGDSLGAALQTVGLKLESRKAPLPVVVVDRIEKAPTAN
jgi:uncharacterized protein (TIGR03435 family)